MAITQADFGKIWASTSPLTPYEFSENNYKEGWNFVGATPPSRQMWDYLQKQNDEKAQWLYLNVVQGIPIGVVQAFAGTNTPDGWLLCDGSAVSRTTYANLFAVIGETYGAGDGSTTFNLPDLSSGAITKEFSDPNNVLKNSATVESNGSFRFTSEPGTRYRIGLNTEGSEEPFPQFYGFKADGNTNSEMSYGDGLSVNMSNTFSTLQQSYQVPMRYIIKY